MFFNKIGVHVSVSARYQSIRLLPGLVMLALMAIAMSPVHAAWQPAQVGTLTNITNIVAGSSSATATSATAYATGLSAGKVVIYSSSNGGTSWTSVNVTGLNMVSAHALAVYTNTSNQTKLVIAGHAPAKNVRSRLEFVVYVIDSSLNQIRDVRSGLEGENYATDLVVTSSGYAYLAGVKGLYRLNVNDTNTALGWGSAGVNIIADQLDVLSNGIIALTRSAGGFFAGVSYFYEGGTGLIQGQVSGLNIGQTSTSYVMSAVAVGGFSPSYYINVGDLTLQGTGRMYKCTASGQSFMQCNDTGGTSLVSNMVANSSGTLYGFSATVSGIGQTTQSSLVSSLDGFNWTPADTALTNMPQEPALIKLASTGTTVLALANGALSYSTATSGGQTPPTTGTSQYDVEVTSIQPSVSAVQANGTFSARVNIRNAGTVTASNVSLTVNVQNGFIQTPPAGCFQGATNATITCSTTTLASNQTAFFNVPIQAASVASGVVSINATLANLAGETDTIDNTRNITVTIGNGGTTFNTGSPPTLVGSDSFTIDLGAIRNQTGIFSANDPDGNNSAVTFAVTTAPIYGTFTPTGTATSGTTWEYKPNSSAKAGDQDFVVITMTDESQQTQTATLRFTFIGERPSSKSGGGAMGPLFVLIAALGVGYVRRRLYA